MDIYLPNQQCCTTFKRFHTQRFIDDTEAKEEAEEEEDEEATEYKNNFIDDEENTLINVVIYG